MSVFKKAFLGSPLGIFKANWLEAQNNSHLSQEAYVSLLGAYPKRVLHAS